MKNCRIILVLLPTILSSTNNTSEIIKETLLVKAPLVLLARSWAGLTTYSYEKGVSKKTQNRIQKNLTALKITPFKLFSSLNELCAQEAYKNTIHRSLSPQKTVTWQSLTQYAAAHFIRDFIFKIAEAFIDKYCHHPIHTLGTQSLLNATEWSIEEIIDQKWGIKLPPLNSWITSQTILKIGIWGITELLISKTSLSH